MHLIEVCGATIFTSIVTIFFQRVFFICHLLFLFPFSLSLMMCLYNWVNYFLIIHLLILDFFLYQPFQKNSWGGARSCSKLVNSLFNQGCMRTGASTSLTPSLQGSAVQNPHHTVSLLHHALQPAVVPKAPAGSLLDSLSLLHLQPPSVRGMNPLPLTPIPILLL